MENNIGEARRNYQIKNGKFTQSDAAKFFGVSRATEFDSPRLHH